MNELEPSLQWTKKEPPQPDWLADAVALCEGEAKARGITPAETKQFLLALEKIYPGTVDLITLGVGPDWPELPDGLPGWHVSQDEYEHFVNNRLSFLATESGLGESRVEKLLCLMEDITDAKCNGQMFPMLNHQDAILEKMPATPAGENVEAALESVASPPPEEKGVRLYECRDLRNSLKKWEGKNYLKITVRLSLELESDDKLRKRARMIKRTLQTVKEAFQQGGLLSQPDLENLLGATTNSISSYVKEAGVAEFMAGHWKTLTAEQREEEYRKRQAEHGTFPQI